MSSIATDEVSVAIHDATLDVGGAPDWIMVIPSDGFSGRDGRGPYEVDPQKVIERTLALGFSAGLPIDYDHASDFAAPNGGRAPAAGWMTDLQVHDGAIWAHVEWTDKGREAVASHEYRYISPVFSHDEKTGEVLTLLRAGLTNSPNLYDTAICSWPTADSLEKTMEIEKFNERRRQIEAIKFPPRIRPGGFRLNLFSPEAIVAINAANSKNKFLPDANDAAYSDDSDDDDSTAAHIQRCKNHLEQCDEAACERAPTDGSPDHMALAHRHLGEAIEQRARGERRDLVSQNSHHTRVRFETQTRE